MTDVALSADGLYKSYPLPGLPLSRSNRFLAVNDVSFGVSEGESLGLVGESGSGKTTVARILVGSIEPDEGIVSVRGRKRQGRARRREARLQRAREVQMVFQDPYLSLDPRRTPHECLDLVLRLHGSGDRGERQRRINELLDQVGLGSREAQALPRELSGGQRQRVAIARALAVEPAVLVLDEATSDLDVSIQAQILQLLQSLRRRVGIAVIFISHDLAVVRMIAERVLVLRQGRVVESGETEQVFTTPSHPYTGLLLAAIPRQGWNPERVLRLRDEFAG